MNDFSLSVLLVNFKLYFENQNENICVDDTDIKSTYTLRTLLGSGKIFIDDKEFILEKDSIIFFKASSPIKMTSLSEKWNFYLSEFIIENDTIRLNEITFCKTSSTEKKNIDLILKNFKDGHLRYASSIFSSLIVYYIDNCFISSFKHKDMMNEVISFIDENYNNINLKISRLAKLCNISERQFRNIFYDYLGKSPQEYIMGVRIKNAIDLISKTTLTLDIISEKVGFKDQFYLSTIIKKKCGKTPKSFRTII